MKNILLLLLLLLPAAIHAAPNANKFFSGPLTDPANYISVDFDKAELSEIVLLVSEFTGTGFVFDESAEMPPITWAQASIYKNNLVSVFIRILTSLGYTVHRIEGTSSFWAIRHDSSLVSDADLSSGTYQLQHVSAEAVMKSAKLLYADRLSVASYKNNQVVAFSGSPVLVVEFAELLDRIDQPALRNESGIAAIRLQHISVRTAIKAVNDLHLFQKPAVFPDYWNRSVIVHGTTEEQDIVHLALSAIDKPQKGYVDQLVFIQTMDPDQAILILSSLYESLSIRKVASDRLLISGEDTLVDKAMSTVNRMDGTGLQVKVEAVIAYLTDREFRELGIKFAYSSSSFTSAINTTLLSANPGTLIDFFDGFFSATFSANDSSSHGQVISSPVLTVLNGKTAKIMVGRNVPFISQTASDDNGDDSTSIERHDVGLSFEVKPVIRPDGDFITLTVSQELSNVTDELSGAVDLVLDKKSLSSTVMVGNGDTIFLGGLRSDETGKAIDRIPLLGDIPYLGELFTYEADKTETRHLVISLRVNVLSAPHG